MIENPKGQEYNETRTDVEANIIGNSVENLIIVDVIKPIIRVKQNKTSQIIQKGIVIVQDRNTITKNEKNNIVPKNSKTEKTKVVKVFVKKGQKLKKRRRK